MHGSPIWFGLLLTLLVNARVLTAQTNSPKVLILNSFHPGYVWSDAEQEGVVRYFQAVRPNVEISLEYLDQQRNPGSSNLARQVSTLHDKYVGVRFEAVIALDQPALDALAANRAVLFPDSPVAFCGVEVLPELKTGSRRWFTGVMERLDPAGTVRLARQLQPGLKRLLVFSSSKDFVGAGEQDFQNLLAGLAPDISVEVRTNAPLSELLSVTDRLDSSTAVLAGIGLKSRQILEFLKARSRAAFYGLQSPNQLAGVVGGSFLDGGQQGEAAARLALRLMAGEEAEKIPVIEQPPLRLSVDYAEARRLGLTLDRLSPEVELRNLPLSYWRQHESIILAALAVILILGLIVVILSWAMHQKRRAEVALGASEQRYRLLVENSQDVVTELNASAQVLFVTASIGPMLGRAPAELMGLSLFTWVHPDDAAALRETLWRSGGSLTCRLRHQDGTWRWTESAGQRFHTDTGEERVVVISRDISARKTAEEQRQKLEERLRQSRKMEALGTLAGGIAHDFNNLLTAIIGNIELMKMTQNLPREARENLAQMDQAGQRAKALVRQIISFSRPHSSHREPVDLHQIAVEALAVIRTTAPAGIRMSLPTIPHPASVWGDPTQLHQVIMNLCTNAVQAMEAAGGLLSVAVEVVELDDAFCWIHQLENAGPHVLLTVSDTGPGMTHETLQRIFEPFFTTKGLGRGTGLGLAVVHGIVQNHHAAITVESRPGEGASFLVYLPLVPIELSAQSTTALVMSASPTSSGGGEPIMLVDDEPMVTTITRQLLESMGHPTTVFNSPQLALQAFVEWPDKFGLIITDLAMPEMSGVALAREILRLRGCMTKK